MVLKTAKVLRSAVPGLKTDAGVQLPVNSRVRVMSFARVTAKANGAEKVKVKVEDPNLPDLEGHVVIASPGAFRETKAGRPRTEA